MFQHLGVQDPSPHDLERNGLLVNNDGLLIHAAAVLPAEIPYPDSLVSSVPHDDTRACDTCRGAIDNGGELDNEGIDTAAEPPSFSGLYWRNPLAPRVVANDPYAELACNRLHAAPEAAPVSAPKASSEAAPEATTEAAPIESSTRGSTRCKDQYISDWVAMADQYVAGTFQ